MRRQALGKEGILSAKIPEKKKKLTCTELKLLLEEPANGNAEMKGKKKKRILDLSQHTKSIRVSVKTYK